MPSLRHRQLSGDERAPEMENAMRLVDYEKLAVQEKWWWCGGVHQENGPVKYLACGKNAQETWEVLKRQLQWQMYLSPHME
jgi:hypothetical protein